MGGGDTSPSGPDWLRLSRRRAGQPVDLPDQPLHMRVEIDLGVNHGRLPVDEIAHVLWQIVPARHRRAVDQDRDHGDVLLERRLDFDAYPIVGVAEPRLARAVVPHPVGADDGEKDIAIVEHPFDVIAEVDADRRRIVIEEHDWLLVGSGSRRVLVMIFQPVEDAAGDPA